MAKKKFWTKCGREFEKSTSALVTGYTIDESDKECANCPFQVEVTKGYPAVHDRWECRAGSQPPNQKDDWKGSLEDKNTISIRSLHNNFLEAVMEYCKTHSDLAASYNQDMEDCRRIISVSCSPNKKGIAAKKALVDKFFGQVPEETPEQRCELCNHAIDEGESVEYIKCKKKRSFVTKKQKACDKYEVITKNDEAPCQYFGGIKKGDTAKYYCACEALPENMPEEYLSYDSKSDADSCASKCKSGKGLELCRFYNDRQKLECRTCQECGLFGENNGQTYECRHIYKTGRTGTTMPTVKACEYFIEKDVDEVISENEKCISKAESCRYYCKHNEGCTLLLVHRNILPDMLNQFGQVDCDIWREKAKTVNETPKNATKSLETVNETAEIVTFDYSTVDEETAGFLQEKAIKINRIRMEAKLKLAVELEDTFAKFAKLPYGNRTELFDQWVGSIGISARTARNYIDGLEWVRENFPSIEDAMDIQPSLLFAVSAKNAPKELQEGVKSGDITSHKQYQELLKEKQEIEKQRNEEKRLKETFSDSYNRLADANHKLNMDCDKERNTRLDLQKEVDKLKKQLDQAKSTGDIEKIQKAESNLKIANQCIADLQIQNQELQQQLKDKPIEVPATQIVEKVVIPDEVKLVIYNKVAALYEGILKLNESEMQIFAEGIDPDSFDDVLENLRRAEEVLEIIENIAINSQLKNDEAAATSELKTAPCEDCEYCTWDGLKEEDDDAGKVICTMYNQLVWNKQGCRNFKER